MKPARKKKPRRWTLCLYPTGQVSGNRLRGLPCYLSQPHEHVRVVEEVKRGK